MVRENDCGTIYSETFDRNEEKTLFGDTFENKIFGKYTSSAVLDASGKEIVGAGELITKDVLVDILHSTANSVSVRSVLTCECEEGVCQKCYGLDLATNDVAKIGTPVGIIAAQSIGEPGTQLTMRTFHSG